MTLQDDLKAKALTLISQQMANWVVDIQRHIGEHQGNLVRALDDLQESVARYDEKINEADIEMAMAEVVANMPPPAAVATGPGFDQLKASLAVLDRGTSLSEVLTHLVNEVAQYVDRAAMFIVKGPSAIGWYARGVEPPDAVKQVNVPLSADTVLRNVNNSRHALRGALTHSPGTAQALARLGGEPQSVLAVPLILRDKLAAILYCDSTQEEVPPAAADLIEILVLYAGKTIDLLSLAPKTTTGPAARPAPPAPAPRPAAPAAPAHQDEGGSTVMFNAQQMQSMRPGAARAAAPAA
ncbi:MAG TPA: GAF domain-containing protein, partial [Vicinamibacteria bacterium]|nr:GAF domain-containing protein [Vicinamibacteria bacterium]